MVKLPVGRANNINKGGGEAQTKSKSRLNSDSSIKGSNNNNNNNNNNVTFTASSSSDDLLLTISTHMSREEKELIETMTSILSKIEVVSPNGDRKKMLPTNEMSEFVRTAITFTCNTYMMKVFPDTSIVAGMPDRESIKEFVAFRKKYMNYPIDAQVNQLKAMGIVKPSSSSSNTNTNSNTNNMMVGGNKDGKSEQEAKHVKA